MSEGFLLSDFSDKVRFCGVCNFAVHVEEVKALRGDMKCPNCGRFSLSGFYKMNSAIHRHKRRMFEEGKMEARLDYKIIIPHPIIEERDA